MKKTLRKCRLLPMFCALLLAQNVWGTITIDGTTATITDLSSDDLESDAFKNQLAGVTKLVIVGSVSSDYWNQVRDKVKDNLTMLDLNKMNPEALSYVKPREMVPNGKDKPIIETVVLPSGITEIPSEYFLNMVALTNVEIPITVTTIGNKAFYNCIGLKHVSLPEGLAHLGEESFKMCSNLESVSLPTTLESIGDGCFQECVKMLSLTIPETEKQPVFGSKLFENSGLRDLYVMTTDENKIPKIIAYNNGSESTSNVKSGTFTKGNLYAFGWSAIENMEDKQVSHYTSAQMETIFMNGSDSRKNNYNGEGIINFHFPPTMRDFYDKNPYQKTDVEEDKDLNNGKYLSDTYLLQDKNGRRWPERVRVGDMNEYNKGHKNDAVVPERHLKREDDEANWDYKRRERAGLATTYNSEADNTEPTALAWRQFLLMSGDVKENEGENFKKVLDDTWYTMCFPFDLSDEQLESLFNANYNICEFTAANIVKTEAGDDALVLYFTKVAKAAYVDEEEDKVYYSGSGDEWQEDGNYQSKNRKFVDAEGNYYSYKGWQDGDKSTTATQWASIRSVLAFAGHPYMIHPNVGVIEGKSAKELGIGDDETVMKRVPRYINGIKKRFTGNGYDPCEDPEASGKGYREIGTDYKDGEKDESGNPKFYLKIHTQKQVDLRDCRTAAEPMKLSSDEWNEMESLGKMTFWGKTKPTTEQPAKIPQNAYFLASLFDERIDGKKISSSFTYPRFYRQPSASPEYGNWTQYTAIVTCNGPASAWLDKNIWSKKHASGAPTDAAKQADVMLFEDISEIAHTETGIGNILNDARSEGQQVKFYPVIYNINGQMMQRGTADMRNLPSGVYVINSKKYFVK